MAERVQILWVLFHSLSVLIFCILSCRIQNVTFNSCQQRFHMGGSVLTRGSVPYMKTLRVELTGGLHSRAHRGVKAILMSFVGTIEGPCCVWNCVEKATFWQLVKNESGGGVLSSILSQIFQIYLYTMRVGVRGCMWDLIFYPVQGAYGSFYPYTQIKTWKKQ